MFGLLRSNYFAPRDYVSYDMKTGVLRARDGARLVAFPEQWSTGLLAGLEDECGDAWPVVMHRCGEWWGKRHMERLERELTAYYGSKLTDMPAVQVHATLAASFAAHGWGALSMDVTRIERGVLVARVENAAMAAALLSAKKDAKGRTVDGLLAGILSGMLSQASGGDVGCQEIACAARGDEQCVFVCTEKARLQEVPAWVRKQMPAAEILDRLDAARAP